MHPSRFAQVIMNMMINALHAIGEETGTVSVRQYHRGDIFYTENFRQRVRNVPGGAGPYI